MRPEPEGGNAPMRAESLESPALASPNTGSQKSLVLLVQFANQANVGSTPAQWSDKFFGPANSVRDYYDEVSYGKLSLDPAAESNGTANDGVVGWLTLNSNHPNTAGNTDERNRLLTRDAINAANQYVNYASYDANGDGYLSARELHVTVIVAGQEAAGWSQLGKSVWGHNWALYGTERPSVDGVVVGDSTRDGGYSQFGEWHGDHMATIGIMVHELGHDLNLPDLYDTDQSSKGVGEWSVMGGGSWLATTGNYQGSSPAHLDPFSKSYEGWLTPQKVSGSNLSTSIQQAETSATAIQLLDNPDGVDWTFYGSSGTGEYFLVENRQRVGYDAALPGTGLLVWHIDETRTSDNGANATDSRRLVDVEEADGFDDLDWSFNRGDAGDPYPGSNNNTLFDGTSNPNSLLYSGSSSGVALSNISGSSSTMSANISTTGGAGDVTAPNTSIASGPSGTTSITSASFGFSSTEAGSRFECSLDGAAFSPCASPKSYTGLASMTHTFGVRAIDAAGNVDATPAVRSWTVDAVLPTVSAMSPRHTSFTTDRTPTIKATVRDNLTNLQKANIKLYVNGVLISPLKYSYSASTDALVYNSPKIAKGKKTVRVVATDTAKNVRSASWYFTIK